MFCVTLLVFVFFFFNDTATTEIYTLSLHDALPISLVRLREELGADLRHEQERGAEEREEPRDHGDRSEEHTSELQSQSNLVCRLLLEKKNSLLVTAESCSVTNSIAAQSASLVPTLS